MPTSKRRDVKDESRRVVWVVSVGSRWDRGREKAPQYSSAYKGKSIRSRDGDVKEL